MTVKELIDQLDKLQPHVRVEVYCGECDVQSDACRVELVDSDPLYEYVLIHREKETMIPKGCDLTECGHTHSGLHVQAVTDLFGAQVVVTDESRPPEDDAVLISLPLENHEAAVNLGNNVVKHGTSIYGRWTGPLGS